MRFGLGVMDCAVWFLCDFEMWILIGIRLLNLYNFE